MFADKQRWKRKLWVKVSEQGVGGIKEVVFLVKGKGAYSKLKYESGVHRVQRVPVTESSGRIHTPAATVAVLPEVEDVDVVINQKWFKNRCWQSGKAEMEDNVNTTDSAVRITHIPTGLVVTCQDEKSQLKNKEKHEDFEVKTYEKYQEEQHKDIADARKSNRPGDRSERIRTYTFLRRVTDHRINMTI